MQSMKQLRMSVLKTVEACQIASSTYQGSYDQITPVNQAVANWVQENGYDFNGPMFTIYHIGPAQTQNPEEWVTEIWLSNSEEIVLWTKN